MYAFMYVDPEKMPVEENFTSTKKIVMRYKKISTTRPVPKHWLRFSYIRSEDYELDQNLDDTELKNQPDNTSNDKVKYFAKLLW